MANLYTIIYVTSTMKYNTNQRTYIVSVICLL